MLPLIYVGRVSIPSYGLCMATGIIVAFVAAFFRLKRRGGSFDSLLLIASAALALGLFCAKVSYYLFSYGVDRLFSELASGDFSGLRDAGLVYYGGLIGGVIGACVAVKASRVDFCDVSNAIVPCIPLGHAFGRIGCLLTGCCYGLHYNGAFAVHSAFVNQAETLFPIQAVESLLNMLLFVALLFYTRTKRNGVITLSVYLIAYSLIRFILEFFRGDLIRGIYWGFSTSQWISVLLIATAAVIIAFSRRNRFNLFTRAFKP